MSIHRTYRLPEHFGEPVRAVIAPAACGGFVLLAEFTRTGLRDIGGDLGIRWEEYDVPNAAEIAAADTELTRHGFTRTTEWQPGTVSGSLSAALTRIPCSTRSQPRVRDRFRAAIRRLISHEEVTR